MPVAVEFGVLGPLVVRRGGVAVPVRRGRQRALLAALLVEANRVVPVGRIAEVLWGPVPPQSGQVAIRNYVRRLREALGEVGQERIVTQPRGYLIRVDEGELDLARFEALLASSRVAAAEGRWEVAAGRAEAALALWRGDALADVESELLAVREAPRLAELRLQAVEISIDATLRLGGQEGAVAELQRLVVAHPLREHLHALLMRALYRCGRQADALAAYRRVRMVLVEELAAEPGAELQLLHRQILAADPALDLSSAAGGPGRREPPMGTGGPAAGVPLQLPATVAYFTGRAGELAALTEMVGGAGANAGAGAGANAEAPGTMVIAAIGGMAGVGKTALAVHWAHQAAGRFPDGQLYVNLRGYGPGTPVAPARAVRGFLEALGVAPRRIPRGADAQQGLYRSLLAGRRMLIVLDNARDERQVRPLLPASPGTVVLTTSRCQLAGLAATDGARLLTLGVLTGAEAGQLLAARLGTDRAAAEPCVMAEIAYLCGYLPLALAIAVARAEARPQLPLAALAAELRDARARLDALDAGDRSASVRAVFSSSICQLSPATAGLFRLLDLHPGPGITVPAAASLAGCTRPAARRALAELTRAHLLTEHTLGRYACHDLLRAYAGDKSTGGDTEHTSSRDAATGRLLDHYLHTAHSAALLLSPALEPVTLTPARPGVTPERLTGYQQAREWFEAEHSVLLAAVTLAATSGFGSHAWQLPWAMTDFFDRTGRWHDQAATQRTALAAAARLGDTAGQAAAHRSLAVACARTGDYDQAQAHLAGCLGLYRELGDTGGEARTQQTLCWVADDQGRRADALGHAENALRLFQAIADHAGRAYALNNLSYCHSRLGNGHDARTFGQQALALHRELGNRHGQAHAWDSLGYAEHQLSRHSQAAACYHKAVSLFQELGDRMSQAESLTHLGDTCAAAGEQHQAHHAWQQALNILDDLNHPRAGHIRTRLAAEDHSRPPAPDRPKPARRPVRLGPAVAGP